MKYQGLDLHLQLQNKFGATNFQKLGHTLGADCGYWQCIFAIHDFWQISFSSSHQVYLSSCLFHLVQTNFTAHQQRLNITQSPVPQVPQSMTHIIEKQELWQEEIKMADRLWVWLYGGCSHLSWIQFCMPPKPPGKKRLKTKRKISHVGLFRTNPFLSLDRW